MNTSPELFQPEHLCPRLRWGKLFEFLPVWPQAGARTGRPPVDRLSLLKALIYQRLRRMRFLRDLHTELSEQPSLLAALGFNPYQPAPSLERFSAFLSDVPHALLQHIRVDLTRTLIEKGVITGRHVGFDSCPVLSAVRENNLKASLRHARYDKTVPPRADPDARLGIRIHHPRPGESRVEFFWGYRNHVLADLESELPLWEITQPNSVGEVSVAIPLLDEARSALALTFESVSADAEYDAEAVLGHILRVHHAQPYIARHPRHRPDHAGFERDADGVRCPAGLRMPRRGKMTVKGVTYIQYSCPFYYGRQRPALLVCPVGHPKFSRQKGCNYLWRLSDNLRDHIPYGTSLFQEHYRRRLAVERIFSRLLAITIQEPSVRGLSSIRNHCTIAHIAVLLVALAAHELGYDDRTRFVRTFVPNLLS